MAPVIATNPPAFPIVRGDGSDSGGTTSTTPSSPFTVSTTRGFLPLADPPAELPPAFAPLEALLQAMPVRRADGQAGLLAHGGVVAAVRGGHDDDGGGDGDDCDDDDDDHDCHGGCLPDLSTEVERWATNDPALATALYRDYSFLASAYLLEPCA
jgi:indoleamine 2,3-dioxygenase